jgi:hypothetical protein
MTEKVIDNNIAKLRLASQITDAKVLILFVNKDEQVIGDYDVTSDFCQAMIDFFGDDESIELKSKDGKEIYTIRLEKELF